MDGPTNGDVDLSIRQICAAWRLLCRDCPDRRIATGGGITYVFSGLPVSFFNIAVLDVPGTSAHALATAGREACAWAADKGVPWFFLVTHEHVGADVDTAAILDGCGLVPALPLTGDDEPYGPATHRAAG